MTGATATESTRDQIIHAAAIRSWRTVTRHQRPGDRDQGGRGDRQPPVLVSTKSELLVEAWRYLTARSVEELRRTLNQLTDPLEVLEIGVESLWDS